MVKINTRISDTPCIYIYIFFLYMYLISRPSSKTKEKDEDFPFKIFFYKKSYAVIYTHSYVIVLGIERYATGS
jgi:hypothetical protein